MKRIILIMIISMLMLTACATTIDKQAGAETEIPAPLISTLEFTATLQPSAMILQPGTTPTRAAAPDPSGEAEKIAFIALDGNVTLLDIESGELQFITNDGSSLTTPPGTFAVQYQNPAWSGDGTLLAFQKSNITTLSDRQEYVDSLVIYDVSTGESYEILAGEALSGFDWKPDSHLIAYTLTTDPGYFNGRGIVDETLAMGVKGYNADTGESMDLVPAQGFSLVSPKWSPDARFLSFDEVLYMEGRGNFAYYDFEAMEYISWGRPIGNYDWAPDGETLVYDYLNYLPSGEEQIWLNDRYDQSETLLAEAEDGDYVFAPKFSADGEYVLYRDAILAFEESQSQLLVKAVEDGETDVILEFAETADAQWSPNSEKILAVIGPFEDSLLVLVDVYDYSTRELGQGWWPVWR